MRKQLVLLALGVFIAASCVVKGEDWPIWRGANGDGISKEKINVKKIKSPKVLWEAKVGEGYSSVVVEGDSLYTAGNISETDYIRCLDASSGKEKWSHSYPCRRGGYKGPRATPVLDNGLLYSFSREGHLICLDAKTGKVKWQQEVQKDGAENIQWGLSSSPVIIGDVVAVNAGQHAMGFDKKTGKKAWGNKGGKGGYASITPFEYKRKKYAAIFGCDELLIVDAAKGKEVASFKWKTKYDVNAADPIIDKDMIFISSGYGRGCAMLKFNGSSLRKSWENKSLRSHFSTPVLVKDYIYGIDGNTGSGDLVCIDIKNGNEKWRQKTGFGSLLVADGVIVVLNERGKLFAFKLSSSMTRELATGQGISGAGKCWTMPALANGRLYLRGSNGKLVCLDVK